jgi:hypothetical protein
MMEIKKLINIVVNDMHELEKLIAELREGDGFNPLELEILQSKAGGIKQLLDILKGRMEEHFTPGNRQTRDQDLPTEKPQEKEEEKAKPFSPEVETPGTEDRTKRPGDSSGFSETESTHGHETPAPETSREESDTMELQEPEEEEKNGKVLGEKFITGKSVNEMISGSGKMEYKLSDRPVNSIRASIGINDRFLFTRELFEGNPERYTEAVTKLDSLRNLNEAVAYLRENFTWKKNETSLKFIDLVKRRFLND